MTRRVITGLHILFALLVLAAEQLGVRAHVGALSGTTPASFDELAIGMVYVAAYFVTVIWVPIWLLAVSLDALCGRLRS